MKLFLYEILQDIPSLPSPASPACPSPAGFPLLCVFEPGTMKSFNTKEFRACRCKDEEILISFLTGELRYFQILEALYHLSLIC